VVSYRTERTQTEGVRGQGAAGDTGVEGRTGQETGYSCCMICIPRHRMLGCLNKGV